MNDLAIEYFLCAARSGSFSKAARELFVSQPAISRQIASLEKELGFTLFDRTNKQSKLTEIGELFYRFFTEIRRACPGHSGHERNLRQAARSRRVPRRSGIFRLCAEVSRAV